jgi:hypothetical protein
LLIDFWILLTYNREKERKKPMADTTTKLNQLEAGRVKTEMERKYGKRILHRELWGYSPEQVAERVNVKAEEIARMAGREK